MLSCRKELPPPPTSNLLQVTTENNGLLKLLVEWFEQNHEAGTQHHGHHSHYGPHLPTGGVQQASPKALQIMTLSYCKRRYEELKHSMRSHQVLGSILFKKFLILLLQFHLNQLLCSLCIVLIEILDIYPLICELILIIDLLFNELLKIMFIISLA